MSPTLPLLSLIVFAPWLGAIALLFLPRLSPAATRILALAFSLSTLALSGLALCSFDPSAAGFQFSEQHAWISSLNVHYRLGLDGLSLILVLLTGVLGPLSILASWRQETNPRLMCMLFLLLQGAALGVFLALDFVPWFLFWELSLVPAYFLIRLWGGPGATRAGYQFVIYTVGGSAFMLLGFAGIFLATGTLDFTVLAGLAADGSLETKLSVLGGVLAHGRVLRGPAGPGREGSALSFPHMVAFGLCRGPDRGIDVHDGRYVEDGSIRLPPDPLAALPGCPSPVRPGARVARPGRGRVWRLCRHAAAGP